MKGHEWGPGDWQTYPPYTGHPLDPRRPPEPEEDSFDNPYEYGEVDYGNCECE